MPAIETDLQKYIAAIDFPLQKAATVYPLKGNQVLLGKKIKVGGIGEGYYIGIGGKPEPEDQGDMETTARREVLEEVVLQIRQLRNMGKAYYYFPFKEKREIWNMDVTLFTCDESNWTGTPQITNEMDPKWFNIPDVPYQEMWDDNKLFLPHVLMGRRIELHAIYGEDNKTVTDYTLKFLDQPTGFK